MAVRALPSISPCGTTVEQPRGTEVVRAYQRMLPEDVTRLGRIAVRSEGATLQTRLPRLDHVLPGPRGRGIRDERPPRSPWLNPSGSQEEARWTLAEIEETTWGVTLREIDGERFVGCCRPAR